MDMNVEDMSKFRALQGSDDVSISDKSLPSERQNQYKNISFKLSDFFFIVTIVTKYSGFSFIQVHYILRDF